MKKNISLILILLNVLLLNAQDKLEAITKFYYVSTTQFDGTLRTTKLNSVLASVNNSNNLVIVDEDFNLSESVIYLNNTQREEKKSDGKMIIHYDSPKYGNNQIAYLDDFSLTLVLPNNQKLMYTVYKPTRTTMVD